MILTIYTNKKEQMSTIRIWYLFNLHATFDVNLDNGHIYYVDNIFFRSYSIFIYKKWLKELWTPKTVNIIHNNLPLEILFSDIL